MRTRRIMKEKVLTTVVTFETTTQAIAMERECKKNKFTGRLIPVPREISASCGLAWKCGEQNEEESLEVMKNRWEEWEEKARKRLKDGEEKLQVSKKELDRATQSLQKFLQEENRKKGQLEEVQRQCEIFKEQEKEMADAAGKKE